jgi:hypothetical protein
LNYCSFTQRYGKLLTDKLDWLGVVKYYILG